MIEKELFMIWIIILRRRCGKKKESDIDLLTVHAQFVFSHLAMCLHLSKEPILQP